MEILTQDESSYIRQEIIEKCRGVAKLAYKVEDPLELCRKAASDLNGVITPYLTVMEALRSPDDRKEEFIKRMQDRINEPGMPGYRTNFKTLNNKLLGLRERCLYTVGARPGIGKTTLLNQLSIGVAEQAQNPCWVIYFSPEQSDPELQDRTVAAFSGLPSYSIATGKHPSGRGLNEVEWRELSKASERIGNLREFTYDVTSQDCDTIKRVIEEVRVMIPDGYPLGGIFVDYLQRMKRVGSSESDSMSKHIRGLKDIAKTENIFAVVASQFNRPQEPGYKPQLSDFRWSGDIEQESDVCMALHWQDADTESNFIPVEFYALKNRHGPLFSVNLTLDRQSTWFQE